MCKAPTILVVEDDRETLGGWVELLRAAGYRVTGAASFEEGRRALTSGPDLLVTDLRLGAYNGLHLVIGGRAANPRLPAIVATAYPDAVLRAEAERLNAVYLEKPVEPRRLLDTIAGALVTTVPADSAGD